jgi:hypothetical protein
MEITKAKLAELIRVVARGRPYVDVSGEGWVINALEIEALIVNTICYDNDQSDNHQRTGDRRRPAGAPRLPARQRRRIGKSLPQHVKGGR